MTYASYRSTADAYIPAYVMLGGLCDLPHSGGYIVVG